MLIQFTSQTWIRKVLRLVMPQVRIHAFTHLFVHSHILFHKYLFQAVSVLGTSLGIEETAVKKKQSSPSHDFKVLTSGG